MAETTEATTLEEVLAELEKVKKEKAELDAILSASTVAIDLTETANTGVIWLKSGNGVVIDGETWIIKHKSFFKLGLFGSKSIFLDRKTTLETFKQILQTSGQQALVKLNK